MTPRIRHQPAQDTGKRPSVLWVSSFFCFHRNVFSGGIGSEQDALRSQLNELGLIAFVGNGAVLPRKSGVDDRPMTKKDSSNLVAAQISALFLKTITGSPKHGFLSRFHVSFWFHKPHRWGQILNFGHFSPKFR